MAAITEDYVSFEVAKSLKEKGFNEPCECAYSAGGQYLLSCYKGIADRRIKNDEALDFSYSFTAPTLQMVMKWLREKHNLFIQITVDFSDGAYPMYDVCVLDLARCTSIIVNGYNRYSYTQACETAIKYSLENLI